MCLDESKPSHNQRECSCSQLTPLFTGEEASAAAAGVRSRSPKEGADDKQRLARETREEGRECNANELFQEVSR